MNALVGGGHGAFRHWKFSFGRKRSSNARQKRHSKPSNSVDGIGGAGYQFPLRQAVTAGSLALAGDTIAQATQRWRKRKDAKGKVEDNELDEGSGWDLISGHDWLRSLRMTSYGFLFYGPGSYAWYQYLDRHMPKQTVKNIMTKVFLNQVILGPAVIAVVFAWNNLWLGKVSQLPEKYKKDLLPTLFYGFRFWVPVSALNFWVVPLQARVGFMSMASIFWNFVLSSTMSK